jgi:hypothetical protein
MAAHAAWTHGLPLGTAAAEPEASAKSERLIYSIPARSTGSTNYASREKASARWIIRLAASER